MFLYYRQMIIPSNIANHIEIAISLKIIAIISLRVSETYNCLIWSNMKQNHHNKRWTAGSEISASLTKSQSYNKAEDIKTLREMLTTTPKVHFSNKHPITELKIQSHALLTADGRWRWHVEKTGNNLQLQSLSAAVNPVTASVTAAEAYGYYSIYRKIKSDSSETNNKYPRCVPPGVLWCRYLRDAVQVRWRCPWCLLWVSSVHTSRRRCSSHGQCFLVRPAPWHSPWRPRTPPTPCFCQSGLPKPIGTGPGPGPGPTGQGDGSTSRMSCRALGPRYIQTVRKQKETSLEKNESNTSCPPEDCSIQLYVLNMSLCLFIS